MDDITFIIPNRGGTHVDYVIDNFKVTFNDFFEDIKFIVIDQDDDTPFKRGQLYNIAVRQADTKWIGLIDNDVINLNVFDPINIYQVLGGPYVCFNRVSQLTLDEELKYSITKTEYRLKGYGAFNFMSKDDFCNCGGFSNLCSGWGAEDNILNEKLHLKRYNNVIGHISHPKRNIKYSKLYEFNKYILKCYKENKINKTDDGYIHTTCEFTHTNAENNITHISVKNIGVINNFKYMEQYNNFKNTEHYSSLKIKHYIITRFLNNDKMNLGQRVLDKDVIETGIGLVKKYLFPSLDHQSNKNFTSILVTHDKLNKKYKEQLLSSPHDFNLMILTNTEYKQFIQKEYDESNEGFFITSRVDYDDMFYCNAVQDIHDSLDGTKPVSIYTWQCGAIKNSIENLFRDYNRDYHNNGGIAIMLTLIINTSLSKPNKMYNVYNFNHTMINSVVKDNFELYSDKKPWYEPLYINKDNVIHWVYIKHDNSNSGNKKFNNKIINLDLKKFFNI